MDKLISELIIFKNVIQMYHWRTKDYRRHVASGDLYKLLDLKFDSIIEILQKNNTVYFDFTSDFKNVDDEQIIIIINKFIQFLVEDYNLKSTYSLLNLRDDILVDLDKTLYLFTLK